MIKAGLQNGNKVDALLWYKPGTLKVQVTNERCTPWLGDPSRARRTRIFSSNIEKSLRVQRVLFECRSEIFRATTATNSDAASL